MSLFKKKILIVEDEVDIAEGIKARLELEKFKVIIATNGKEGVEKARATMPDLIILDIMMPVVNGYVTCEILKTETKTKQIPILVLTALPHIKDADKAFEAGADDFLNKPFSNERLIKKVRKLLRLTRKE